MGCQTSTNLENGTIEEFEDGFSALVARKEFVKEKYTPKCAFGNPHISLDNVVFISKDKFLELEKLAKYEDCKRYHETASRVSAESVILFICHRWGMPKESLSSDDSYLNAQFLIIKNFLESRNGQGITHVWIDYSCITQDKSGDGFRQFKMEIDNVQTALLLAAKVLVLPRVLFAQEHQNNQDEEEVARWGWCYTDLEEFCRRGWCMFELLGAMLAQCDLWVTFIAGKCSVQQFQNAKYASMKDEGKRKNGIVEFLKMAPDLDPVTQVSHALLQQGMAKIVDETKRRIEQEIQQENEEEKEAEEERKKQKERDRRRSLGSISVDDNFQIDNSHVIEQQKERKYKLVKQWEDNRLQDTLTSRTLKPLVRRAMDIFSRNQEVDYGLAFGNWEAARDPADLVVRLVVQLQDHIRLGVKVNRMASLTLPISGDSQEARTGKAIATLLQEFTVDSDDVVVTNLLANLSAFCMTGFQEVERKSEVELDDIFVGKEDISEITLKKNELSPEDLGKVLEKSPKGKTRKSVDLWGNPLGYHGAKVLEQHGDESISKLNLNSCMIGDEGVKTLATWFKGEELSLNANNISDEGVQTLTALNSLKILHLTSNRITDEGAKKLAKCTNLEILYLNDNSIGDEGAEELATTENLKILSLSINKITDSGATALARNKVLQSLYLSGNELTEKGRKHLMKAWSGGNKMVTRVAVDGTVRARTWTNESTADGQVKSRALTEDEIEGLSREGALYL